MLLRNKIIITISVSVILGACVILLWPFASITETSIRIPVKISAMHQGLILTGPRNRCERSKDGPGNLEGAGTLGLTGGNEAGSARRSP